MRVVVTGGAGFIGANLVRRLLEEGDEVVVVDDLSTGRAANLDGVEVDFREGSILDESLLDDAFSGAEAIVHLAAIPSVPRSLVDPLASHQANATGTLRVLEAARKVGAHVTVASSSSVYGANPELPKRESMRCAPMSPYAVSKLAGESYAIAYAECFDLRTLAFRFFNVFGPLQPAGHAYAAVVPAFVDAALAGRPVPLDGDGSQTRDFTYVGTVCSALTTAARSAVTSPTPVNLAFGTRTSLRELIALIEDRLGRSLPIEQRPARAGDVPHSQADSGRLRELFPDLEAVPLEVGLDATLDWFRGAGQR